MPRSLPFTKMEGTGNDYIYVNGFVEQIQNPEELAQKISDRHFGVGGDGLVLILPSAIADARMRMFNADGTEAEMCGNATRCVGKYLYDHGIVKKELLTLETGAGVKIIRLDVEHGVVRGATVDMGEPILDPILIPIAPPTPLTDKFCINYPIDIDGQTYAITTVSMGNPHAVLFMKQIEQLNLPELGPKFENHPLFPKRTNTEFVEILSRSRIRMRVWERGAGETLACGTGACAAVVASNLNDLTEREVEVEVRGGKLKINWDETSGHVFMKGPAVTVFSGNYFL